MSLLADLILGRFVVTAQYPLEPHAEPIPGCRYRTRSDAIHAMPWVAQLPPGKYALARLDVAEIPSRRATRGIRAGVTRHRGRRWAA